MTPAKFEGGKNDGMSDEPKKWLATRKVGLIAVLLALCVVLEIIAEIVGRH